MANKEKLTRTLTGRVLSDKMDKSITVLVERREAHPLYLKYVTKSTKITAHDENNESKQGDLVAIEQCRPISKNKSWRLVKIVEKSQVV